MKEICYKCGKEIVPSQIPIPKNYMNNYIHNTDLTHEFIYDLWLKQDKKCALTNVPISFEDSTARISRLVPDNGYFKPNVHLVHKVVNLMKLKVDITTFLYFCTKVHKQRNKKSFSEVYLHL